KNIDPTVVASNWPAMSNLYTTYKNAYTAGRKPTYSEIGGLIAFARMAKSQNQTALSTDAANLAIQIMSNEGLNFNQMQTNINSAVVTPNLNWTDVVFANIQPEVGRYLKDNVAVSASAYLDKITSMKYIPNWYQAWSEHQGYLDKSAYAFSINTNGFIAEEPYYLPIISYSLFLGKAYVQDLSQTTLQKYLDVPWSIGDLYYLQKLVATIEAPVSSVWTAAAPSPAPSAFSISNVTDNSSAYSLSLIPKYEKFELTFNVNNTVATNLQIPYETVTPPGLTAGAGISVDAIITQPDGSTVKQPAFLYQDYDRSQVGNTERLYPKGSPVWKVRFAPTMTGTYQYRLQATDASGTVYYPSSGTLSFSATNPLPGNHGFLKVAGNDKRYFEFSDGTPFNGVGLNTSFSDTYNTDAQLTKYSRNGINFLRSWMSGSTVAGSAWAPWVAYPFSNYGGYIPNSALGPAPAGSGFDYTFNLSSPSSTSSPGCIENGFLGHGPIPVKPSTKYRITITAKVSNVVGPKDPTDANYGLTAKVTGYRTDCPDTKAVPAILPYQGNTAAFTSFSGDYTTGASDQLLGGNLWIVLHNTLSGNASISSITMQEVNADGSLGPNILDKSDSDMHKNYDLKTSWQWDYVFDNAAKNNVYLKTVLLEKNDVVWNNIKPDGTVTATGSNNNFYAAANTKVGRLEQYFYRYVIARWGYSRAVHSWEFTNEGDPYNGNHYAAADSFASYMHQNDPARHMATTSFWAAYPLAEFWGNSLYPNVDYTDLHAYATSGLTEWQVPPGTTWDQTNSVSASGGSLKVPAGNGQNMGIGPVKGLGDWTFSVWMKTDSLTGTCPYGATSNMAGPVLTVSVNGSTTTRVIPYDPAMPDKYFICTNNFTGTNGWTKFSGVIPISDNDYHSFQIGFSTGWASSGTAWFDNLTITSPSGQNFYPFGDNTFDTNPNLQNDTADLNRSFSTRYQVNSAWGSPDKPIVRGETGISDPATGGELATLKNDTQGVWLHNLLWGEINPGGMVDLYWWHDSIDANNLWGLFKPFSTFISTLPLNSGRYQDVAAQTSNPALRAWGQRDTQSGHAYLWIQNINHTWNNVVNNIAITPVSGTISFSGFAPNTSYNVSWFNTSTAATTAATTTTDSNGVVTLTLPAPLSSDIAVTVGNPNLSACLITSATWGSSSATVGDSVPLTVSTSGNCTNQQINVSVFKNGLLGGPATVSPGVLPIIANKATAAWVAEDHPDILNILNPSQYYFKTNIVGDAKVIQSADPLLSVYAKSAAAQSSPSPSAVIPPPVPQTYTSPGGGSPSGGGGGGSSGGGGGGAPSGGSAPSGGGESAKANLGDINGDGRINIFDLSVMLRNWNKRGGSGDLNHDGLTNIFDLSIMLRNWGK
ncbi:MAG: hypothetical protein M1609_03350, partial [Firmicutes bacterium]|nr:hypothetical protein [Bacillota bacterium]